MADKNQLLALLSRHIGEANGITAEGITLAIGVPKRRVRTMVSELRLDGVAVCGHPRDGYYIAANPEEVERTCRFLRARAAQSDARIEIASRPTARPGRTAAPEDVKTHGRK